MYLTQFGTEGLKEPPELQLHVGHFNLINRLVEEAVHVVGAELPGPAPV